MFEFVKSPSEKNGNFYPAKVYYDSLKIIDKPTFTFINDRKKFGVPEVFRLVKMQPIRYIFIIVNGQQLPAFDTNLERDRLFGQPLTGIHRVLERGIWRGKCKVYTKNAAPSVATSLWHAYQQTALVLNILNPKYDWQNITHENTKAVHYILKLITEIVKQIQKAGHALPLVFITGYSRGAVFALRLTRMLKAVVSITAVVTLDPVISEINETDELCVGWGIKEKRTWRIIWKENLGGIHLGANSFPILENPGVPCYNVFQRKSFLAFNSVLEKPIGSAVHGAKAPEPKRQWQIKPVAARTPFNQYDLSLDRHSAVLEKYSGWILEIAGEKCPLSTQKTPAKA
jgi:hypothetical protein